MRESVIQEAKEFVAVMEAAGSIPKATSIIRDLLKELPEWYPIATAPTYGEFLVTGFMFNDRLKGRWTCVANGSDGFPVDDTGDVLEYATNWMPLPKPPKEELSELDAALNSIPSAPTVPTEYQMMRKEE